VCLDAVSTIVNSRGEVTNGTKDRSSGTRGRR